MDKINGIKKFKQIKKIILIVLCLIILISGILYIFSPTTQLVNKLKKINGTYYKLERNNKAIAHYGKCKIVVYPTEHLKNMNLKDNDSNKEMICLEVGSPGIDEYSTMSISVVSIEDNDDIIESMNKILDIKEPKISRKCNTFNYFVYDGRNYFYNLNLQGGIMFVTAINDKYLYWVMCSNYKNLTKEDIESILYFEKI